MEDAAWEMLLQVHQGISVHFRAPQCTLGHLLHTCGHWNLLLVSLWGVILLGQSLGLSSLGGVILG